MGYQSDQLIPLVIQLKTGVKEFDVHHNNGWSWMFCLQLIPSLQSPVPSPVSHQKNTNHSDLSRLRSLRIITAIELISRRSEYCHRSELSDRRGTSLFYRKSLVHRAAGVRKSFPDGCRSDKIIIDCLIIVPINRDIVSFSYHNLPIFWSSTLIKLSYKSKPLVF